MAQFYTIEEAAAKVGLSVDDFKRNLATKWTNVSRFPDGRSIRFKADQIDELARTLGRGSEPDLQLADEPLTLDDDTDFLALKDDSDDAIDVVPGGKKKGKKTGSDSDVKLEPASGKLPKPKAPTEINLDAEVTSKPPSSTRKFAAPLDIASEVDVGLRPPAKGDTGSSSEFELSLAPDSSDEIELRLTDDSSDEIDIGVMPSKGLSRGDSGINLQSPADSGISLEKSSDFELDLAPDSGVRSKPKSGGPKSGPKKPAVPEDSDSEFELTLDDSDEGAAVKDSTQAFKDPESKDIFETDFELPTLDEESGSEVEELGETDLESSDFDLALGEDDAPSEDESDSEVVALEEGRGRRRAADDEDEYDDLAEADEDEVVAPARASAPAEWGVAAPLMLLLCVPVMFLSGLMAFELLRGMWGYHAAAKPSAPLVRFVADLMGNELPKDQ